MAAVLVVVWSDNPDPDGAAAAGMAALTVAIVVTWAWVAVHRRVVEVGQAILWCCLSLGLFALDSVITGEPSALLSLFLAWLGLTVAADEPPLAPTATTTQSA